MNNRDEAKEKNITPPQFRGGVIISKLFDDKRYRKRLR